MKSKNKKLTYSKSGVDIDKANDLIENIKPIVAKTLNDRVISDLGGFGGLFELDINAYKRPVLVSGTDGVGTKVMLAKQLSSFDQIGIDLVAMCVNDVITLGAKPLFFLDYFATSKLKNSEATKIIKGIADGCIQSEMALIGGETAEMPGVYSNKDIEIVGFSVGIVSERNLLKSSSVNVGDIVLGLASNGIHTNGFSLIRNKLNLDNDSSLLTKYFDELKCELGQALTTPHKPYHPLIKQVKNNIKSMAHITGGGISENLPRALPSDLAAIINLSSWDVPILFNLLEKLMKVDSSEMFRVFNMGLGMILIATPEAANNIRSILPEVIVIGEIQERNNGHQVKFV